MNNTWLRIAVAVTLATLAVTGWLYGELPATIPLHWNRAGEVDRHGARLAAWAIPAMMAATLALLMVLPRLSPRAFSIERFAGTYWFGAMAATALLAYVQALLLWAAQGDGVDLRRALVTGVAVFLALLGNVMGKVRRNFWFGVRTPWTLASERVWYATHRMASKTMVAASLAALLALWRDIDPATAVALLLGGVLLPVAYSLVYYKRLERSGQLDA